MADHFREALDFTLRWEGGYVHDARDPGGETKFGISKRAHPDLDIANLTRDQAGAVYRRDYWDRLRCFDLPRPVALAVFDFAVNSGRARAGRILQRAYNFLVAAAPPLKIDGRIGPVTAHAISALDNGCKAHLLAHRVLARRLEMLCRLKTARHYIHGWARRVADLGLLIDNGLRWPEV